MKAKSIILKHTEKESYVYVLHCHNEIVSTWETPEKATTEQARLEVLGEQIHIYPQLIDQKSIPNSMQRRIREREERAHLNLTRLESF